jgi:hypothetical protein
VKQKSQLQLYSSQLYSRLASVISFMLVLRIFAQINGWEVQAKQQLHTLILKQNGLVPVVFCLDLVQPGQHHIQQT